MLSGVNPDSVLPKNTSHSTCVHVLDSLLVEFVLDVDKTAEKNARSSTRFMKAAEGHMIMTMQDRAFAFLLDAVVV